MVDDIWRWEHIDTAVAVSQRSRPESLAAAAAAPCVCGGEWPAFVGRSFLLNGIPIARVCYDVMNALNTGRSEATPVIVFAGKSGGEGKSVFFQATPCGIRWARLQHAYWEGGWELPLAGPAAREGCVPRRVPL